MHPEDTETEEEDTIAVTAILMEAKVDMEVQVPIVEVEVDTVEEKTTMEEIKEATTTLEIIMVQGQVGMGLVELEELVTEIIIIQILV